MPIDPYDCCGSICMNELNTNEQYNPESPWKSTGM